MQRAAYGRRLASAFNLKNPPTLIARLDEELQLAVTELRHLEPGFGFNAPIASEPAYLIGLQLMAIHRHELWLNGRSVPVTALAPGASRICDLRCNPVIWLPEPFHPLVFYVPLKALATLAESLGLPASIELRYSPGASFDDPVINHLGRCLLPALHAEHQNQQLFVDQVLLALRTHLLSQYSGHGRLPSEPHGGLAPWQQRHAMELMREHLSEGIALEVVAQACGLSASTFIRLFNTSVGKSPHQWLIEQRIELACELMRDPVVTLADVACAAGFADQSHFTRTFIRRVGVTPGAWRASTHTSDQP